MKDCVHVFIYFTLCMDILLVKFGSKSIKIFIRDLCVYMWWGGYIWSDLWVLIWHYAREINKYFFFSCSSCAIQKWKLCTTKNKNLFILSLCSNTVRMHVGVVENPWLEILATNFLLVCKISIVTHFCVQENLPQRHTFFRSFYTVRHVSC